jgi:hypothetical protein
MCLHIILAEILREMDASEHVPYKRKSRWKVRMKRKINNGVRKIVNVTGELQNKAIIHLPNYKTRHKKHRRWKPRTFFKERRVTKKNKKESMRNKAIKIMSSRLSTALALTHAYATHINTQGRNTPVYTNFHPSSYDIYVDNCVSRSITNNMSDFIDKPTQVDVKIYGTNGISTGTLMGTVEWEIEDDYGTVHKICIPNTIYSSVNRNRLLSPQHWAQGANDRYPIRYGIWCATYDDRIVLYWNQRKYKRTVYLLEEGSNVGVIRGVRDVEREEEYDKLVRAFESEIITVPTVLETIQHATEEHMEESQRSPTSNHVANHNENLNSAMNEVTNEGDVYYKTNYKFGDADSIEDLSLHREKETDPIGKHQKQEYLRWHHKLGHLSHGKMLQLISNGNLPKYLAMKTPPICIACVNGKATKKPWRTKGKVIANRQATFPGECVAVDQLESSTAGFIGQLRGAILTNQRYRYATVFVDLYSDYTFIYMHTAITTDETIKAKKAFETHAESFGVRIRQYHADNGRFQDIKFKEDCAV